MFEYRDHNDALVIEQPVPGTSGRTGVNENLAVAELRDIRPQATAMIRTAYPSSSADNRNQAIHIVRDNTMTELLSAAVNAVIAETLGTSLEKVQPDSRLVTDLGMSAQTQKLLQQELAFIFNSNDINITDSMNVECILEQIAKIEFTRLNLRVPA